MEQRVSESEPKKSEESVRASYVLDGKKYAVIRQFVGEKEAGVLMAELAERMAIRERDA